MSASGQRLLDHRVQIWVAECPPLVGAQIITGEGCVGICLTAAVKVVIRLYAGERGLETFDHCGAPIVYRSTVYLTKVPSQRFAFAGAANYMARLRHAGRGPSGGAGRGHAPPMSEVPSSKKRRHEERGPQGYVWHGIDI